ncbi:MAG: hypothetical protein Q9181_008232, partial [Wetmoreana brouardii]
PSSAPFPSSSLSPKTVSLWSSMPTELRLQILQNLPNVETLINLILASRKDYEIYKDFQETILPNVILNQFQTKTVLDLRQQATIIEICIDDADESVSGICGVVESCYRQCQAGLDVKLDLPACKTLLTLHNARLWRRSKSESEPYDRMEPIGSGTHFDDYPAYGKQHCTWNLDVDH